MRSKPSPRRSTPNVNARGCALMMALAGLCLASSLPSGARADACPNAEFRSGPSEHLPDCRAYEQASPVEKDGADAVTVQPLFPAQSSACEAGETCATAYMNAAAAFGGAAGNELPNAYISTRGAAGWQTTAVTPPTAQAPASGTASVGYAFSTDLSQVVLRVPFQQLTQDAPAGVYNLFVRQSNGGYSLVTATPPAEPPQTGCGGCFEHEDVPAFAGASLDFNHVIFEASDSLVEGAPGGGVENLYETTDEHVRLVGVLPDGAIPPEGATAGGGISVVGERTNELEDAISQNGSDVLFQALADGGAPDPLQAGTTQLYDRLDGAATVEVSAPAPGAEPSQCETPKRICDPGSAQYWGASAGGASAFFTSKAALTTRSNTGIPEIGHAEDPGNDLYRYELGSRTLTDLTPDAGDPDGAEVLGVVGSSVEGSYVYFVAKGELASGALSGQPNLYVWHGASEGPGAVKFIATLSAPDSEEELNIEAARAGAAFPYRSDVADWTKHPTESQAYVTPDGRHLAFMSVNRLTGYDNEDQVEPEADHEVFEYSAETGQLVCASCDPSGARPLGSAFIGAKLTERVSTPFHQPRSLSADGSRLFFTSPDPLIAGLAGANAKVFEYEDGQIALISGSGGGSDDVFLDASASGDDVFFATRERLTSADSDELVDVYDARVDGGFSAPSAPAAACQGSVCQGALDPSPAFGFPASSTLAGAGNLVAPSSAGHTSKPTSKQLLARALAKCRRVKNRKRRSSCVDSAKRRYAHQAGRRRRAAQERRRSHG